MSMAEQDGPVTWSVEDGVGVIVCDNPPVNALSQAVRAGLLAAIEALEADEGARTILVSCAGRTFFAGADIREFNAPPSLPYLPELIDRIEACSKPVTAAIFGTALGGGLELAMGCHWRIGEKSAHLGLPEVKLGLLPGAGGTQRLPRLAGPSTALSWIASGRMAGVKEALEAGVVDRIAQAATPAAFAEEARLFAAEREGIPLEQRRTTKMRAKIDPWRGRLAEFDALAERALARSRGLDAPKACARAVRAALTTSLPQTLKLERDLFLELKAGEQSAALRHLFFAERAAQKIDGMPREAKPRPVRKAAVIGAGTMGSGIATALALAGIRVALIDADAASLERGLAAARSNIDRAIAKADGEGEERRKAAADVEGASALSACGDADLVIEAVFEDMALKKRIFAELDKIAPQGAVLATNTSTLDVDEIAAATQRPQDVVGMHFFSPAHVMRLVEVVRGARSGFEALATALGVTQRLGKLPVTVGVCYGFVGNRMLHARGGQVEQLLLEGATPAQIDAAMTGYGFAMGPCAVGDLAGLDVGWRARKQAGRIAPVADAICELGRFGQKTGAGYFRYEAGSRTPIPDPAVDALIARLAAEAGVKRRAVAPQEIVERLIYCMVNEGARILEEGIAARASDIDIIWVNGYGFPPQKGGPMFHADRQGLGEVAARLEHYAKEGAKGLEIAPLLARLARENGSFSSFDRDKARG
jgi:3-hydroxyacyl-CoA dehydrogenase